MAPVPEKALLGGSLEISRMVTGLWQLAGGHDQEVNLDDCVAQLKPLIEAGLTSFDMADHYGPAEEVFGTLNSKDAAARKTYQASTKWCPKPGPTSLEIATEAVDLALKRMGQSTIDLMQYHIWEYSDPSYLENLKHLQVLQQQGKIAHIGVTNTDLLHLKLIQSCGVKLVSNQVSTSVIDRRIQTTEMGKWCKENDVGILCYGTLMGGFLSEKWLGAPEPEVAENWSLSKYKRFIDVSGGWESFQVVLRALSTVALKHKVPISAVATRWVLDLPGVAGVIVGSRLASTTAKYTELNLQAFAFEMDQKDKDLIAEAQAGLKDIPGDSGDEYRRAPFLTATGDLSDHLDGPDGNLCRVEKIIAAGGRVEISGNSPWEPIAGYCRANRVGNNISVSGTTTTGKIGGSSAACQAIHIFDIIERAVNSLGGSLKDVIRSRIFLRNVSDCEEVSKIHGSVFGRLGIRPANTLIGGLDLVGESMLVEIEVDAIVGSGKGEVIRL